MPVDITLDFSTIVAAARHRATAFHLNWTAPILGAAGTERSRLTRYRRFLESIDEMRASGIPIIWTLHNVLPHECGDPALEAQFRQEIADRADLIHVMCADTVASAAEQYVIPEHKVRMIPHPAYVDIYPNLVDQETARYQLGIRPDDVVYLFFGGVRPYKGVDLLLDAFERLAVHRPKSRLIIAGKPGRFDGIDEIQQRARSHPAILSNFNSVGEIDIQQYMNAADVVVLPYRYGLNSGALMLAYSFARPIVAADTGCLTDLVTDRTGITFSWEDGASALYDALLAAEKLRQPAYRDAAFKQAAAYHYRDLSHQFSELVDEALEIVRRRAPKPDD